MLGLPVKLSETPGTIHRHPPQLGEHTRDVLSMDLGLDDDRIDQLAATGVVRVRNGRRASESP
jgi:formyl-CoA transferase/CoA:oxalate CoA-transferase